MRRDLRKNSVGGCYTILIKVPEKIILDVGCLESLNFLSGYYVYTGRSRKGIHSRIQRHITKEKRCRWHIDYLTSADGVEVLDSIIYPSEAEEECFLNKQVCSLPGALILHPGFGSSDCLMGCESHLVYFKQKPCLE